MSEDTLLAGIEAELATLHLDRASAIDEVMPGLHEYMGVENLLVFTPIERSDRGLTIERFHAHAFPDAARVKHRFEQFMRSSPRRYAWYDPTCPEPEQRNRFIDALDLMPREELERSKIYTQVLVPLDLHRRRQPRMLLCDGPALLAWFGSFSTDEATPRQRTRLERVAPIVRQRLAIERRLERAPRSFTALEHCLELLGTPAFVLATNGTICETNAAGRALLETRGTETRAALVDATRGRAAAIGFELTRLEHAGAPSGWLAILPAHTDDDRIVAAVEQAARRWGLTPRQRTVLVHVVTGTPNTTIATHLRISVRAIELHVSKLLDRAGVDSRAALVARVLLG